MKAWECIFKKLKCFISMDGILDKVKKNLVMHVPRKQGKQEIHHQVAEHQWQVQEEYGTFDHALFQTHTKGSWYPS